MEYVIAMRRHHPAPETMDIHHRERSANALERARKLLDAAGVKS